MARLGICQAPEAGGNQYRCPSVSEASSGGSANNHRDTDGQQHDWADARKVLKMIRDVREPERIHVEEAERWKERDDEEQQGGKR